jgi:hypothetical protein
MAIWRSFIAEKAIPFGDHLLLKKQCHLAIIYC